MDIDYFIKQFLIKSMKKNLLAIAAFALLLTSCETKIGRKGRPYSAGGKM